MVSLTAGELEEAIYALEYTRSQVGERYAWPGDPKVTRYRYKLNRLIKKLKTERRIRT